MAMVVAVAAIYQYNIFQWGNYPDFGFSFRSSTGVGVIGLVRENGRDAGLQLGDRILLVNGKIYNTLDEFRAAMHRVTGENNTYLLERKERQFQVTITSVPIGLKRAFGRSGLPYIIGLCYALIGTLVFLMKPHKNTSWIFFIFAATFGLYLTFIYQISQITPSWLDNFHIFIHTFTPAVFIHLILSFPEERRILKRHGNIQFFPYLASAIMFLGIRYSAPSVGEANRLWFIASVGYIAIGVLLFIGSCIQLLISSSSQIVKIRAKVILLGSAISASVPLTNLVISAIFGIYILPSTVYQLPFLIVFPLFVGYSIVKHDLFDFDTFIKRTYGYILTTGAIGGIYALFVFVSNLAFGRFEVTKSPMFPLIFILAVVFLFNPVRNRVQRFIDRVFYRLEYDYRETVQRISETMRTLLGLDEIGKSIMDTALGVMFIDSGRVMILDRAKQGYECLTMAGKKEEREGRIEEESTVPVEKIQKEEEASEVEIVEREEGVPKEGSEEELRLSKLKLPADDPLIQKIAERKKEVTIYDIQEDPFFEAERESYQKAFDQIEATLIVPLIYEDRLTGLISLGQKKSGKFYRREDIDLLNTLANQGAVAIENAMLLEEVIEKERMEEELAIAHDLQTSMLPAACPEIEGFKIAALSTSAREVGGDFYDFIEMEKGKVGLVIGDVTGKSVSGALVMSSSRSVFRMLSEEELTVGEIMIRANRRIKLDIKSGMFVALLYAVLNAEDRILSLCSAGQTQPIHLSAKTGEATLVETEGDKFPLGILEDADYKETRLQLKHGDKVVLYTDGIVEAMNEKEEMFGFERLLEVVRGSQSMTADSLLKEIIDRINVFAGDATQHDDLTVIVVSAAE